MKKTINRLSIKQTIGLSYLIILIIIFVAVPFSFDYTAKSNIRNGMVSDAKVIAHTLAGESSLGIIYKSDEIIRHSIDDVLSFPSVNEAAVLDKKGEALIGDLKGKLNISGDLLASFKEGSHILNENESSFQMIEPIYIKQDESLSGGGIPLDNDASFRGELIGYAYILISKKRMNRTISDIKASNLNVLITISTLIFIFLMVAAQRATLSLSSLSHIMKSADVSTFKKVGLQGPSEAYELTKSFNSLMSELKVITENLEIKVRDRTQDLKEEKQKAEQLLIENRKLVNSMNQILEDERKSIASELHDDLNSALIVVKLYLSQLTPIIDEISSEKGESILGNIKRSVQEVYVSGRRIIHKLRPEIIETAGFQSAVNELINNFKAATVNITFIFEYHLDGLKLSEDQSIGLYRIIQESLNNSIKYADASRIYIYVYHKTEDELDFVDLVITDNGKGFIQNEGSRGIGLIGLRERAFGLGGKLNIDSTLNSGTIISLSLPY